MTKAHSVQSITWIQTFLDNLSNNHKRTLALITDAKYIALLQLEVQQLKNINKQKGKKLCQKTLPTYKHFEIYMYNQKFYLCFLITSSQIRSLRQFSIEIYKVSWTFRVTQILASHNYGSQKGTYQYFFSIFSFMCMYCRSFFVLFRLANVLSVLL